ncbi:MAG: PKD domain-containing protein [Proteobacteria bacterium]|nr:PKD domain-containing protein [Pseudomonadota bacterium]
MGTRILLGTAIAFALVGCDDTSGLAGADELRAALIADPEVVQIGFPIRFDAGESTDSFGKAARFSDSTFDEFAWDFGDGDLLVTDEYLVDHTYAAPGTYIASVTVIEGDREASADVEVTVNHPPPSVIEIDVSSDEKAVIGEWLSIEGRSFRESNTPTVEFEGVEAPNVAFESEFQILVQVPPRTASGWNTVRVDFPNEIEGDANFEVWVTRYGLATDAWRGRTYIVEFGAGEEAWMRSQSLELDDAAVARISGDGSFALIGDARYQATLAPSVTVVDMTADHHPVATADLTDLGIGPLFDIAIAADVPTAVVTDAGGFVVLDLTDPANPVMIGEREPFDFSELAPTAAAISPDGLRIAFLSTFNDRVRFYSVTPTGPIYDANYVDVGPGTQDLGVLRDEELLYVLGGGGEGALPPDLDFGNTSLTVVDFSGSPATNYHGDGTFLDLSGGAPVPIDMAIAPSGTAYVTTLDQNFGDVLGAFEDIAGNPGNIGAWQTLLESLSGIGFGSAIPIEGALEGSLTVGEGWFTPFGFQAGIDIRFDEGMYIGTAIGLGTTVEFLTDGELLHLSLDIDYAVVIADTVAGTVEVIPQFSEAVVSYIDFQLNYDLGPLINLLLPPYAFGDAAIQP